MIVFDTPLTLDIHWYYQILIETLFLSELMGLPWSNRDLIPIKQQESISHL